MAFLALFTSQLNKQTRYFIITMKTIITYMTRFGSTEEYAKILANELKCKAVKAEELKLNDYENIIAMSGTYGGRLPIIKFLKENWNKIKDKKLTIIAVGLVPQENWWSKVNYFLLPWNIKRKANYYKILGRDPDSKKPVDKNKLKEIIKELKIK